MKITVYADKALPFVHEGVLIGKEPVEVTQTPWLDAQIAAGLLKVVATEKPVKAETAKTTTKTTAAKK